MDYPTKNQRFQQMTRKLINIAEKDQKITKSEARLLKHIQMSVDEFESEVKKALLDGVITENERLILKRIEDSLLKDVFDFIEDDENIDKDIEKMLELIFDILMQSL